MIYLNNGNPAVVYSIFPSQSVILRVGSNPDGSGAWTTQVVAGPGFQVGLSFGFLSCTYTTKCGGTGITLVGGVPNIVLFQSQQGWVYLRRGRSIFDGLHRD